MGPHRWLRCRVALQQSTCPGGTGHAPLRHIPFPCKLFLGWKRYFTNFLVIGLSLLFPFWHQRNNKKLLHFQRSEEDVLEELQFQPLHTVHHGLLGGSKASSSSHNKVQQNVNPTLGKRLEVQTVSSCFCHPPPKKTHQHSIPLFFNYYC